MKSDDLDSPKRIFRRSFVGELPRRVTVPLWLTTLVVLGATIVFLHDSLPSRFQEFVGLIWSGFVGAWLVVIFAWRSAWQTYVHNEDRWLASLPFPFDAESYKEMLHRKMSRARCIVIVETNSAETQTQQHVSTALRGHHVEKVLERRSGTFEVRSVLFETTTDSEDYSVYSNIRLHQWFKGYVSNVLLPLHAVGIVEKVRVEAKD